MVERLTTNVSISSTPRNTMRGLLYLRMSLLDIEQDLRRQNAFCKATGPVGAGGRR